MRLRCPLPTSVRTPKACKTPRWGEALALRIAEPTAVTARLATTIAIRPAKPPSVKVRNSPRHRPPDRVAGRRKASETVAVINTSWVRASGISRQARVKDRRAVFFYSAFVSRGFIRGPGGAPRSKLARTARDEGFLVFFDEEDLAQVEWPPTVGRIQSLDAARRALDGGRRLLADPHQFKLLQSRRYAQRLCKVGQACSAPRL